MKNTLTSSKLNDIIHSDASIELLAMLYYSFQQLLHHKHSIQLGQDHISRCA